MSAGARRRGAIVLVAAALALGGCATPAPTPEAGVSAIDGLPLAIWARLGEEAGEASFERFRLGAPEADSGAWLELGSAKAMGAVDTARAAAAIAALDDRELTEALGIVVTAHGQAERALADGERRLVARARAARVTPQVENLSGFREAGDVARYIHAVTALVVPELAAIYHAGGDYSDAGLPAWALALEAASPYALAHAFTLRASELRDRALASDITEVVCNTPRVSLDDGARVDYRVDCGDALSERGGEIVVAPRIRVAGLTYHYQLPGTINAGAGDVRLRYRAGEGVRVVNDTPWMIEVQSVGLTLGESTRRFDALSGMLPQRSRVRLISEADLAIGERERTLSVSTPEERSAFRLTAHLEARYLNSRGLSIAIAERREYTLEELLRQRD
ncbi:hypothetical protein J2T57_001686 [Natronocella acetinitrilica]|uniref:Uncharacterized protein n=1 Tax=Natronocella acetinitrilica TaxID=414046 RepID=A0AAE3KBA8_9GAMM|nr:hypothetical protein [Natronocella acetinitrilica]MCP1674584.1 hypothetical protein [Natronocella acetinitrilica]